VKRNSERLHNTTGTETGATHSLELLVEEFQFYWYYIVYKQWSGCALMNEIKENNYDVNVLWKGNNAFLLVLENEFVLKIACDCEFS
jgi:hypothetical protein